MKFEGTELKYVTETKIVTEEVQGSWVCHEAINGSHLLS